MDVKKMAETWLSWHRNPINAVLHIIGIPMTFIAGLFIIKKMFLTAAALFIGGYVMQFIGHAIEGNEAGEVRLLKKLLKKK